MGKGWWLATACMLAVGTAANISGQQAKMGNGKGRSGCPHAPGPGPGAFLEVALGNN